MPNKPREEPGESGTMMGAEKALEPSGFDGSVLRVMNTSSNEADGSGGDRHSWENRIQLEKQSNEPSAGNTDTLFAGGGSVFPASDQERPLPLFMAPPFSPIIYYTGVIGFGLTCWASST